MVGTHAISALASKCAESTGRIEMVEETRFYLTKATLAKRVFASTAIIAAGLFLFFELLVPGAEVYGETVPVPIISFLKILVVMAVLFFVMHLYLTLLYLFHDGPSVVVNDKGVWIFERMKDEPLPWEKIEGYRLVKYDRGPFKKPGKEIHIEAATHKDYMRKFLGIITLKPKLVPPALGVPLEELEAAVEKHTRKLA